MRFGYRERVTDTDLQERIHGILAEKRLLGATRHEASLRRTLILAKPDAVARSLSGEILARFERRGLVVRAARLVRASRELGETHYAEHREKPFFGELVSFITRSPLVAMVVEGPEAFKVMRTLMGTTNPREAAPGTIRGDLAIEMGENLIHGSDSPESAEREIAIFFPGRA